MIGTFLRIGLINLRRDRVAQALTFLLPIMFFSIFASVFGNQRNATSRISVPVADEDQSEYSRKLVKALAAEGGLRVVTTKDRNAGTLSAAGGVRLEGSKDAGPEGPPLTRSDIETAVKNGAYSVGIVLPKGFSEGRNIFQNDPARPKIQVLADVSDPIAPQMVMGLLQKVSFTAAPDMLAVDGMGMLEKYGGPLTPQQKQSMDSWQKLLADQTAAGKTAKDAEGFVGVPIELVNVMQPGGDSKPTVSFYAAGIGVMFLLFSVTGASGTLLEEVDSGTLGRLVGSRAGMTGVLAGKWLFTALTGMAQLTVMFIWGAVAFGLPLMSHLPGFAVMTVFTAAAASGFGLLLATLSKTRAQLSGLSTIIILAMSAVGGSMFPRFLMSEGMQKMGLATFNAWALDGYIKVFWREAPIIDLWPQLLVLTGLCVAFLTGARMAARKWETL
ncbi:MAG TPA: ABC transporter permease [Vicinamibacterales bacterium]|nr:ABC transporter permease [Vicinamibacterales bacterium]